MKKIAVAVIVAASAARYAILWKTANPYLALVTLASCMDMLAAGALVALVKDRRPVLFIGAIGLALVTWGFAIVGWDGFASTPDWMPKASFVLTGLGLLFSPLMVVAERVPLLASAPLRYVGKISYGLYIWHLLTFALAERLPVGDEWQGAIGVVPAFVVATLSWYLFESKILKLKYLFGSTVREPERRA